MKKLYLATVLVAVFIGVATMCAAQHSIISTVVGYGTYGATCDNCPATSTAIDASCISIDRWSNLYITEWPRIRKVNAAGIITTIAGGGTLDTVRGPATALMLDEPAGTAQDDAGNLYIADGASGGWRNSVWKVDPTGTMSIFAGIGVEYIDGACSGDGGPATDAGFKMPVDVITDASGNVYICELGDAGGFFKVDGGGIIHTIGGTCFSGMSGDGGPATSAMVDPVAMARDAAGNIYFIQGCCLIRKIDLYGIISTIGGTGASGFSGDGGPATAAILEAFGICVDQVGNVYFSDRMNVVRKISADGSITSIAGNCIAGYSGDGGDARFAQLNMPYGITIDGGNNLYVVDNINASVRKITVSPDVVADSFNVTLNKNCSNVLFSINVPHYSAGLSVKTWFGDGQSATLPVSGTLGGGYASLTHAYGAKGLYPVKHILYRGAAPVDSVAYPFRYTLCRTLSFRFYYATHGACGYDAAVDPDITLPMTAEIDSNGVPIDTVSFTSGFYYDAKGDSGDVYSCKLLSTPTGFYPLCPSSGIVYDTLQIFSHPDHMIGLSCSSIPGFDLGFSSHVQTGRHAAKTDFVLYNNTCVPADGTLSVNFSPKYIFDQAYPNPSSVTGNTVSWNVAGLASTASRPVNISVSLKIPTTTWLLPGDTIHQVYTLTPATSGDLDMTNNTDTRVDTVKTSYDPNEIVVSPSGYIPSGTTLRYTIGFENTGNDTAFNIYVMDTLSDDVDPRSFRVLTGSAKMDVTRFSGGGHNILKFDFPGINLPDSSHHSQCDGMVIFTIKTKNGLTDSTAIYNSAGIYFDDNPVVATNRVENIICNGDCNAPQIDQVTAITANAKFSIYPNPATNQLVIKMDKGAFTSATICDPLGQEVIHQPLQFMQTSIDLSALPAGVYTVMLRGANGVSVQRLIKK